MCIKTGHSLLQLHRPMMLLPTCQSSHDAAIRELHLSSQTEFAFSSSLGYMPLYPTVIFIILDHRGKWIMSGLRYM